MAMQLTRRQFTATSAGLAAAVLSQAFQRRTFALATSGDPFAKMDAVAQAQAIAKGETTALEVVEAAIGRIERINPFINAVVTTDFDAARSRARDGKLAGPFAGVPFLVKDLDDFAGVRTTNGARALLSYVPKATDPYIEACVKTGLNVVGKSNTPEFGLTGTTESLALGPCYNPWDLSHSSGGSSGGAGAAVAAGMVPVAQGSDGGGSIRIPASCCGVFGLKPSRGRLVGSRDEFGFSVTGVLSRSVRDTAHMLAHTERQQPAPGLKPIGLVTAPGKKRLKIGMYLKGAYGDEASPEVCEAVLSTAKLCEELGHDVRIARFSFNGQQMGYDFLTVWSKYAGEAVEQLEKERGRKVNLQDLEPLTLAFARMYQSSGKNEIPAANKRLQELSARLSKQMEPFDVLLSPVLSSVPPVIGEHSPTIPYQVLIERMTSYVAYTPVFNVTGMPAMSVPLGWNTDSGLPIGSHFAAKAGDERTLLELAYELEQAQPWASQWARYSAANMPG
jgi:amidase